MQYSTVQCGAVLQYSAVRCSTVWCSCSVAQCNVLKILNWCLFFLIGTHILSPNTHFLSQLARKWAGLVVQEFSDQVIGGCTYCERPASLHVQLLSIQLISLLHSLLFLLLLKKKQHTYANPESHFLTHRWRRRWIKACQ